MWPAAARTAANVPCLLYTSIYIVVANPVDILTYQFCKTSGLPEHHIIGSGTILDTARLRSRLSEYYNINQQNVHAYVFGEHGDTSFVPWSLANISNIPITQYLSLIHISDYGYHILRLEEIIPAGAIPLDSVKAELTEELLASKQETTFIQMIEEWKKDINIELHLDLIDMTQEEYDAIVSGEDTASEDDAAE